MPARSSTEDVSQQALVGTEVDLIPLYVTREVADALAHLQQALRTDARLYRHVELMLGRMQPLTTHGPLTDCLRVLVGTNDSTT